MENIIQDSAVAYQQRCTPDEYLAMEWENGIRYEYWDGELIEMSGATIAHGLITHNLNTYFRSKLKSKKWISFQESIRLKIKEKDIYFLPDVVVTCDEKDLDLQEKTVQSPVLVVEVLSNSSELYDRNRKWDLYRQIRSLRYYLLVSQDTCRVEMFSRQNSTSIYSYQVFDALEGSIFFPEWQIELSLTDIYEDIAF